MKRPVASPEARSDGGLPRGAGPRGLGLRSARMPWASIRDALEVPRAALSDRLIPHVELSRHHRAPQTVPRQQQDAGAPHQVRTRPWPVCQRGQRGALSVRPAPAEPIGRPVRMPALLVEKTATPRLVVFSSGRDQLANPGFCDSMSILRRRVSERAPSPGPKALEADDIVCGTPVAGA